MDPRGRWGNGSQGTIGVAFAAYGGLSITSSTISRCPTPSKTLQRGFNYIKKGKCN